MACIAALIARSIWRRAACYSASAKARAGSWTTARRSSSFACSARSSSSAARWPASVGMIGSRRCTRPATRQRSSDTHLLCSLCASCGVLAVYGEQLVGWLLWLVRAAWDVLRRARRLACGCACAGGVRACRSGRQFRPAVDFTAVRVQLEVAACGCSSAASRSGQVFIARAPTGCETSRRKPRASLACHAGAPVIQAARRVCVRFPASP